MLKMFSTEKPMSNIEHNIASSLSGDPLGLLSPWTYYLELDQYGTGFLTLFCT